jgi:hypothetical protein
MRQLPLVWLFVLLSFTAHAGDTLYMDDAGRALRQYYLGFDVTHKWLRGYIVRWETGEIYKQGVFYEKGHSHCSAFAAAACKKAGIYILRPPSHSTRLLANAQYDWLNTKAARRKGWRRIDSDDPYTNYADAQQYANEGNMVVAVWHNPDTSRPGHIAMVMPDDVSLDQIRANGPMVTQAGNNNYDEAPLTTGFRTTSWPGRSIVYYYNKRRPRLHQ